MMTGVPFRKRLLPGFVASRQLTDREIHRGKGIDWPRL